MSQVEPLSPQHTTVESLTRRLEDPTVRLMLAGGVALLAYLPLLVLHVFRLEQHKHYGFYPLIPIGAAALAWLRWPEVHVLRPGNVWVTIPTVLLATLLQVLAVLLYSPYMSAISFLVLALAVMYGLGGPSFVRKMLPVWLFMWLMIPLPFRLDEKLVQNLQVLTAHWSSRILDKVGIMHVMTGNAVELPGQRLLIEEACSGIQSLFACLAFTMFYVFWFRHPIIRGTILFVSAIGWVLVANALRVVLITWGSQHGYESVANAESWQHTMLGVVVFIFVMLMIASTDQLMRFFVTGFSLGRPRVAERTPRHTEPVTPPTQSWFATYNAMPVVAVYGLLFFAQLYLLWPSGGGNEEDVQARWQKTLAGLNEASMPATLDGGWKRTGFMQEARPTFDAQYSAIWQYQKGGKTMFLAIDSAFLDWHNLFVCYRGLGWTVHDEKNFPVAPGEPLPRTEGRLDMVGFRQGYVTFHLYDPHGEPIKAVADSIWGRFVNRISNITAAWQEQSESTLYYQVQVFMEGYSAPTDEDVADMRKALAQITGSSKAWLTTPTAPAVASR